MASPSSTAARHPFASLRKPFETASGHRGTLYSLPALARKYPGIRRLRV